MSISAVIPKKINTPIEYNEKVTLIFFNYLKSYLHLFTEYKV